MPTVHQKRAASGLAQLGEGVSKQEILAGQLKRITLTAKKSLAARAPLNLKRILNRS
jgi:hypothetical protein